MPRLVSDLQEKITTLSSQACSVLQLPDIQPSVCMHAGTCTLEDGLSMSATAAKQLFQRVPADAFTIRPGGKGNTRWPPAWPHDWHNIPFHCWTWQDPSDLLTRLELYPSFVLIVLLGWFRKQVLGCTSLKTNMRGKARIYLVPCCPVWACQFPLSACSKSRSYCTGGHSSCWAGLRSSSWS